MGGATPAGDGPKTSQKSKGQSFLQRTAAHAPQPVAFPDKRKRALHQSASPSRNQGAQLMGAALPGAFPVRSAQAAKSARPDSGNRSGPGVDPKPSGEAGPSHQTARDEQPMGAAANRPSRADGPSNLTVTSIRHEQGSGSARAGKMYGRPGKKARRRAREYRRMEGTERMPWPGPSRGGAGNAGGIRPAGPGGNSANFVPLNLPRGGFPPLGPQLPGNQPQRVPGPQPLMATTMGAPATGAGANWEVPRVPAGRTQAPIAMRLGTMPRGENRRAGPPRSPPRSGMPSTSRQEHGGQPLPPNRGPWPRGNTGPGEILRLVTQPGVNDNLAVTVPGAAGGQWAPTDPAMFQYPMPVQPFYGPPLDGGVVFPGALPGMATPTEAVVMLRTFANMLGAHFTQRPQPPTEEEPPPPPPPRRN